MYYGVRKCLSFAGRVRRSADARGGSTDLGPVEFVGSKLLSVECVIAVVVVAVVVIVVVAIVVVVVVVFYIYIYIHFSIIISPALIY